MANPFRGMNVDLVVGAESRGFIFGIAIAQALSCGFVPVRKPGKLPRKVRAVEYSLEYGKDRLEIHADAILPKRRVLLVDDLLATGGTLRACAHLLLEMGASLVGISVLIELPALGGAGKLKPMGRFDRPATDGAAVLNSLVPGASCPMPCLLKEVFDREEQALDTGHRAPVTKKSLGNFPRLGRVILLPIWDYGKMPRIGVGLVHMRRGPPHVRRRPHVALVALPRHLDVRRAAATMCWLSLRSTSSMSQLVQVLFCTHSK
jgi:adenine phosphoribosyltransferase